MSAAASGPPPPIARIVLAALRGIGVTLASIVTVIIVTSLWWRLTPTNDLDVLVYDQTVPDETAAQHLALDQLLEYHRVERIDDGYVGLVPGTWEQQGVWPTDQPDLIVLADTAGVQVDEAGRLDPTGARSVGVGITLEQAGDVARWVAAGTPAYGEFALVTEPTPGSAGMMLEELFGYRSTGWRMRIFDDLLEVPPGIRSLGPDPWPFTGPGLVAVSGPAAGRSPERKLVVLPGNHLTADSFTITGGPPGSDGGTAPFDGWVTVVDAAPGSIVDAIVEVPLAPNGATAFEQAGIPRTFAALIRTDHTLYFAGDAMNDDTPFRLRRLHGGATFTRLVTGEEFRFLYQVLEPSIGWLLDGVETTREERGRLTLGSPTMANRHGRSVALEIPTRGPEATFADITGSPGRSRTGDPGPSRSTPSWRRSMPSAEVSFPGPEQ